MNESRDILEPRRRPSSASAPAGVIPAPADGVIRPPTPADLEAEAGAGHALHLDIDLNTGEIRKVRYRVWPTPAGGLS
jgi:hypothetical protein